MSFLLRVSHGSCQTAGWCVLICIWDPASGSFRLLPVAGGWRFLCVGCELGLLSAAGGHPHAFSGTPSHAARPSAKPAVETLPWVEPLPSKSLCQQASGPFEGSTDQARHTQDNYKINQFQTTIIPQNQNSFTATPR